MQANEEQGQRICRNCGYQLSPDDKYCGRCSQKYTTGKVPFLHIFSEFIHTIFNFDSTIFVTLRDLVVPGKLTQQYFMGRHKRYVHPLRLFLVTALAHFAIIGLHLGGEEGLEAEFSGEDFMTSTYHQDFVTNLEQTTATLKQKYPTPIVDTAFNSLTFQLKKRFPYQDSIDLSYNIFSGKSLSAGRNMKQRDLRVAYRDYSKLSADELLDKYQVHEFWERLFGKQFIKVRKKGSSFGVFIFSKLTWMAFLMMPVLALILKLLYIRNQRYYVEHLIFSFHYHAFAFLLVSIMVLGATYLPDYVIVLLSFGIFLYLYKAMRKVYQQGRWKTFLKFCLLNLSYLVLFVLFIALTFVVGFFLF